MHVANFETVGWPILIRSAFNATSIELTGIIAETDTYGACPTEFQTEHRLSR